MRATYVSDEKKYPLCEQLRSRHSDRHILAEFLEWLADVKELDVCSALQDADHPMNYATNTHDRLILEYFGIDRDKLEAERRAMLSALQEKT